ncbi:MAG: Fic family protein [Lachnospiraceae bacterium]|nr:Fic family protein [Lachnospiraceae bacterium]
MRNFDYTQLSKKSWNNDILLLCSKIHECKGRQELFIRQKPAQLTKLTEIARIQSTEASNRIEGIVTTDTRMKQLFKDKTTPRNRDEREILGYRDVLNTIHESYEYINIEPKHILQLHRDLFKHAGFSYGGNFKNTQNYIKETLSDGSEKIRFTPLAPYETTEAIEKICKSYNETNALEIVDPLILIPAFICDFLCIHPFNDGNGRMSRLLTLLLLYKSGYEVGKYISIEKQIEKTKDVYYDALQDIDLGWHEEQNDPTPFIRYILQMILACYLEFDERVGIMDDAGVKSTSYDVVKAFVDTKLGKFTASDVLVGCPTLGRTSAFAALKKLVEEEYIEKQGERRNAFYVKRNDSIW